MNPINYAKGLLDELETAVRTGAKELETAVRAELKAIAPDAKQAIAELRGLVDPVTIRNARHEEVPSKAAADIRAVGARLDEALADKPRTAAKAGQDKAPAAPGAQ